MDIDRLLVVQPDCGEQVRGTLHAHVFWCFLDTGYGWGALCWLIHKPVVIVVLTRTLLTHACTKPSLTRVTGA